MTKDSSLPERHDHSFGQDRRKPGEAKTFIVILITATMMVVEIAAGILFGSMALLADGLHMASHAAALAISAFAYVYARRYANDARYSFGTGKVNALGGFSGAVLLAIFALMMGWESFTRILRPVEIAFDQAIFVAVLGLIVNGACVAIFGHEENHDDRHSEDHDHVSHVHGKADHHHDHNLRAAYFHVLADALTSVLAIFALLAGKYFGLNWMDPVMGIFGAILVARWSFGLLCSTSGILLDRQAASEIVTAIRASIESHDSDRIQDLHVWSIGPGIYAVEIAIVTQSPRPPDYYKGRIPRQLGCVHVTVEVHD